MHVCEYIYVCGCWLQWSSVDELAVVYPDRVITIQGTVGNMVDAQAAISVKLAECIEKDMQSTNGVRVFVLLK